jgi:nitrogen fixation/metabolism regulation signal transduction histidine kinase
MKKILKIAKSFEKIANSSKDLFKRLEEGDDPNDFSDDELFQMFNQMGGSLDQVQQADKSKRQEENDSDKFFQSAMGQAEEALGVDLKALIKDDPEPIKFVGVLLGSPLDNLYDLEKEVREAFQDFVYGRLIFAHEEVRHYVANALKARELTDAQKELLLAPVLDSLED